MAVGENGGFLPNGKSILDEILCSCSLQNSTSPQKKSE